MLHSSLLVASIAAAVGAAAQGPYPNAKDSNGYVAAIFQRNRSVLIILDTTCPRIHRPDPRLYHWP